MSLAVARVGGATRAFVLALDCCTPPMAVDVDLENRCVMYESIHSGQCHGWIGETLPEAPNG